MENIGAAPQPTRSWAAEDEIDLRQYLDVLILWWREILAITLMVIVLAGAALYTLTLLEEPVYSAEAKVAIVRTFTEVSFDERYRDVAPEAAAAQLTTADSRRNALLALVQSGSIAEAVLSELGDLLSEEEREPALLLERVDATLQEVGSARGSDLIGISATADSPEKAAVLVNAWTTAYVDDVNRVFGQVPDDVVRAVAVQLTESESTYNSSQEAYQSFVGDNRINELSRQIAERQRIINELQRAKDTAVTALINEAVQSQQRIIAAYLEAQTDNQLVTFEKEQEGRLALITRYIDALNSAQLSVFEEQVARNLQTLQLYYDEALRTDVFLDRAQTLRAQVANGGDSAAQSNAAALQILATQITGGAVVLPEITFDSTELEGNRTVIERLPAEGENTVIFNPPNVQIDSDVPSASQSVVPAINIELQIGALDDVSAEAMLADVDALIEALQTRVETLQTRIDTLSQELLSGDSYAYLGETVAEESALVQTIQESAPEIAQPDLVAGSALSTTEESPFTTLTQERAAQLLQLQGLEGVVDYNTEDERLTQAINELQREVQTLQAELEAEQSRELRLQQQRDRDAETFNTVSNRVAELQIEAVSANSEVRLASLAVPPVDPEPSFSLRLGLAAAGVLGVLLGVFVAFLASYLGQPPFLSRRRRPATAAA